MHDLSGISVFVAVVEEGSFTAAADFLGLSKSAVSKQVRRLEQRLGAQLLNRTTRRLSLTEVGRTFHERCRRIVEEAEAAELAVTSLQETPRGTLRVTAPLSFGIAHLAAALPAFMDTYPDISVDIDFSDRRVDLLEDGFDLAIRIGDLEDSSLIARRVSQSRRAVWAAPDYWARHGKPEHPNDLTGHACLGYAYLSTPMSWSFKEPGGGPFAVKIKGRLISNNGNVLARAAAAGHGCVMLPTFICRDLVAKGALESALEIYQADPVGIYVVYPPNRHLSTKVRVLIDFLVDRFSSPEASWP